MECTQRFLTIWNGYGIQCPNFSTNDFNHISDRKLWSVHKDFLLSGMDMGYSVQTFQPMILIIFQIGSYGVYTKVSYYLEWIWDTVARNGGAHACYH